MNPAKTLFVSMIVSALLASTSFAADTRSAFLKLIDRPRVPLAPQVRTSAPTTAPAAGLVQYDFSYAADAEQRVPGILVRAENSSGRRPVVISMHGTGGEKMGELPYLRTLAKRGFIAVAIDGRYHGARTKTGKGSAEYQDAILKSWRDPNETREHPFFYDTAWDIMRLVDYLEARDDVDPQRIGIFGTSKGGIEVYLAAAVDPRLSVVVPAIGVQSFGWALQNDSWQSRIGTVQTAVDAMARDLKHDKTDAWVVQKFYDRVAPGIYSDFDGPQMVPLIAPRPLMMINGDIDPRTPMPGLKLCIDAAKLAYGTTGVSDHLLVRIQPNTGHKVNPDSKDAAVEWFVRWLKP